MLRPLVLLLLITSCTHTHEKRTETNSANSDYVPPTRSRAECATEIQQVKSEFADRASRQVLGIYSPRPAFLVIPPSGVTALRGKTVQILFRIDEDGLVGPSDVRVIGLAPEDSTIARRLAVYYQESRFQPAVFKGCAVPFPRLFPLTVRF